MRKKSFDGALSLEETSIKVVEFERIGWVVSGWSIEGDKNVVQFELHEDGLFPTPCVFRRKRLKPLPGFEPVGLPGKLLKKGEPVDAVLYRWKG